MTNLSLNDKLISVSIFDEVDDLGNFVKFLKNSYNLYWKQQLDNLFFAVEAINRLSKNEKHSLLEKLNSEKYRDKVIPDFYNKILHFDDCYKSKILVILLNELFNERLTDFEFLKLSKTVNDAFYNDLIIFVTNPNECVGRIEFCSSFINSCLISIKQQHVVFEEVGFVKFEITKLGYKFIEMMKNIN
jgi:hypothetical protein